MQPIIQHLFQASSLDDVSRERLESFIEEYPSFGIGHYLLSRKLRAEGAGHYSEETQKTSLYFSNPFWLQWLLESSEQVARPVARVAEPVMAPLEKSSAPVEELRAAEPITEEAPAEPIAVEVPAEPIAEPVLQEQQGATTVMALAEEAFHTEPAGADIAHEAEESRAGSVVALAEAAAAEGEPSASELLLQSIQEAKGLRESLQKMTDDFNASKSIPNEVALPVEEPIKDEEPPFILEEKEEVPAKEEVSVKEEVAVPAVQVAAEATMQVVAEPVEQVAAEPNPVQVLAEPAIVFEPYHTIDYFASQGIKLTLEENPSDQLGKQLKSFTDWLKVMRRLPQKEREIIPDRAIEQTIQTIAAHSVVGREVVTETMAEVLAKQGMPERARAVYEKLSLLNPDKRAYFATKIEQLNIH